MSGRWGFLCLLALPAWSQSVISVYSGVVNYSEGSVLLDNSPLEQKPGRFAEIKPGSEFRVEEGRAEVLLTPGVYLRMGTGSSIRMVSNLLVDTKINLLNGPAIIDAAEPNPQTSVTLILGNYQVHIRKAGRYRMDTLPLELRVTDGEAEVTSEGAKPTVVETGHLLHLLSGVLMASYSIDDDLDNWDQDRSEAIARGSKELSDTPEIASLVDAAKNDPVLGDATLGNPSLAGLGASGGTLGSYPLGGIYSGTSPYGYGGGLSSPGYPYSYGLGLSPYSYPYGMYSGLYPYGLYTLPGLLVLPTYRSGITIRSNLPGILGLSGFSGYRGFGYGTTGAGTLRNPATVYRPSAPAGIRTAPSGVRSAPALGGRPGGHIGGVHR